MKKLCFVLLLGGALSIAQSCQKDNTITPLDTTINNSTTNNEVVMDCIEGLEVSIDSLPQLIQDYLMTNYPNTNVDNGEMYDDSGIITYELEIDNTVLVFNDSGNLLAILDETPVPVSDISIDILTVIETEFPSDTIESAYNSLHHTGEQVLVVELKNGNELVFDVNGNLLCMDQASSLDDDNGDNDNDNDGDNDDGNEDNDGDNDDGSDGDENDIDLNDLPLVLQEMLNNLFPGMTPTGADIETLCDNSEVIAIELEDSTNDTKVVAYFDITGNFIQTGIEIDSADLPAIVTGAVSTNYADYMLDNSAFQLELSDGSLQYEVELTSTVSGNADLYVLFDVEGNVICERNDD